MKHNFDAVALLNNDAIANKDWLRNLTKAMVTQHADIVTSLLLSGDGKKIDTSGDIYSYWGIHFPRQRGVASAKALNSGFIFGASGGASLYKTKLFRGIGLFDEKFFAYYEDVDISFRAQLTNHKIYYEKSAIAYHDHGTTSSKISGFTVYQTFKNLPMLFWKNVPASLLFPIGFRLFIIYCLFFASAFSRGDFRYALKGFLASVKLFPYAIHQRQKIQKSKKISTDALKSILYHQIPPDQTKLRRLFYGEK
jgi:GT2 family glycosyltransferase